MGWHASSDPRKRELDIRRTEAESYKQEMSEAEKRRNKENKEINSEVGIELAPLMVDKVTGRPRRDPSTGYMMNHREAVNVEEIKNEWKFPYRMGAGGRWDNHKSDQK